MDYSNNTIRRAEEILGYGITNIAGEREFSIIDGVLYTDLYENDPTIAGITDFKKAFNGRVGGTTYFNQIILPTCRQGTVEVSANWGSTTFNADIAGLLTWLEENPSSDALESAGVKSKKIEDFSVSLGTALEKQSDLSVILHEGYGFYISRPVLIDVTGEQRHDYRHF